MKCTPNIGHFTCGFFFLYFPPTFFNFLKSIQFHQLRASAGLKIPPQFTPTATRSTGVITPAPFTPTATRSAGVKTPAPFTSTSNAPAQASKYLHRLLQPLRAAQASEHPHRLLLPATRYNTNNQQHVTIPKTASHTQSNTTKAKKTPPFPAASPECNSGRAGKEGGFRRERNHASKVAVSLPPKARV